MAESCEPNDDNVRACRTDSAHCPRAVTACPRQAMFRSAETLLDPEIVDAQVELADMDDDTMTGFRRVAKTQSFSSALDRAVPAVP